MFADCEDFENIFLKWPNAPFFRSKLIAVKSSTNAYINTVCQLAQQESKRVWRGIVWYPDRLLREYEKGLRRKTEEMKK